MLLCALGPDGPRLLAPPAGSAPGARVWLEAGAGGPGGAGLEEPAPDAQLSGKAKTWERVAADLATDADGRACYRGRPWAVPVGDDRLPVVGWPAAPIG